MAKKPNAANITHALAQLGGGAKKDGGGGMMQGARNLLQYGAFFNSQQQSKSNEIETSNSFLLEDKNDDK